MESQAQLKNWVITSIKEAAWAPLCILGIYSVGLALHIYKSYPWIDIPTHFLGGVTITYFFRTAIRNSQKIVGAIPHPIQILFAFTATGTTAVLWEIYENLADHFLHTHMVRGLEDTITDLVSGLMGALVLTLLYRRRG